MSLATVLGSVAASVLIASNNYDPASHLVFNFEGLDDESSYSCNIEKIWGVSTNTAPVNTQTSTSPKDGANAATFTNAPQVNYRIPLSVEPAYSTFNMGSGDFTIEFWLKASAEPGSNGLFGIGGTASNNAYKAYYDATANQILFAFVDSAGTRSNAYFDLDTDGVTVANMWNGTWHHIACVRNGTETAVYVDGLKGSGPKTIGAVALNWSATVGSQTSLDIGGSLSATNRADPCTAQHDELRVTKGVARYTANFTPPSAPFPRNSTDPQWSNVILLVGFNKLEGVFRGGSNALTFNYVNKNEIGRYMGKYGLRRFQTAGNSANGYYIAYSPDFDFGAGDFTVEVFKTRSINNDWPAALQQIIGVWHETNGYRSWRIIWNSTKFTFQYSTDGITTTSVDFGGVATKDTDQTLAVCRLGTTLRLYLNGNLVTTATIGTASIFSGSTNNTVLSLLGSSTDGASITNGTVYTDGFIKGLRINKGLARYVSASYTVPNPIPIV